MRTTKRLLALALAAAVLPGCGGDDKDGRAVDNTPTPVASTALFNPADASALPFPFDGVFLGTTDGSINIPGKLNSNTAATPVAAAFADPQTALNTMDGFSTTAAMVVRFSGAVDPDSFTTGLSVFESSTIDAASKTVTGIARELVQGVDYVTSVLQGTTGLIIPTKPLKPGTTHLIVLTNDLRTTSGDPVTADLAYGAAKLAASGNASLDAQVAAHEGVTAAYTAGTGDPTDDIAAADIILSYGVSTQNVGSALAAAKLTVGAVSAGIDINGGAALVPAGPSPQSAANLYAGVLGGIPSFMAADGMVNNTNVWEGDPASWANDAVIGPTNAAICAGAFGADGTNKDNLVPCNGFFPELKGTAVVPLLVSVPANADTACTAAPMKVVIYQHGITSNRGTLAALADALASQCAVGVAIDLPKHGILPSDPNFGGLSTAASGGERLVPSVDPTPEAPLGSCSAAQPVDVTGSGDYYCPPGDGFINLTNLANSRDTVRQGVSDLHGLFTALTLGRLSAGDVGLSTAEISTDDIHFVGVSLGGVVGMPFAAQEADLVTTTINVSSGGIAKLLDGSGSFEPVITAGLSAAAGINKPSGDYEGFLIIAQTMVDNTDPINFATEVVAAEESPTYWGSNKVAGGAGAARPTLVQEVTGPASSFVDCTLGLNADPQEVSGCPDQTVPNNVFGSGFGPAWGNVSWSEQSGWLAGQNTFTIPSPLAGTDPLAQGTAFLALDNFGVLGDPIDQADVLAGAGVDAFFGMRLPQVGSAGCTAADCSGVVRFTSGVHSSLLSPTADLAVTTLMQTQVAGFIASNGQVVAADPAAGSETQIVAD